MVRRFGEPQEKKREERRLCERSELGNNNKPISIQRSRNLQMPLALFFLLLFLSLSKPLQEYRNSRPVRSTAGKVSGRREEK